MIEPLSATHRYIDVRLYDGRTIQIDSHGVTSLYSDIGGRRFDLSWRVNGLPWHDSMANVLIGLLSTHSPHYAGSCANYLGAFIRTLEALPGGMPPAFRLEHLETFATARPISTWPFVQAVLKRCANFRMAGIDPAIGTFLEQPEKWEERGNGQYFALIANDPERGALTEQELRSAWDALNLAYSEGVITTFEWALAAYLFGTGLRPVQIARTLKRDAIETTGPEGRELTLLVTIAKTRDSKKTARWRRKCPTQLAEILRIYLATPEVASKSDDEPLFLGTSVRVSQTLTAIFRKLKTHSHRLDGPIPLFPYRFRYTLGTRAIALGARDEEVARLLTHTSLHCIRYYRASLPSLQKPIQEAIGPEMTIFARAFRGRLIDTLSDATRANDEAALITAYEHLNGANLGACGTRAECYQNAPRACLLCHEFEPFREAPWEDLRTTLVGDRDVEVEERIREITQRQIDAVDDIIRDRDDTAKRAA